VRAADIDRELGRRQHGYGRGERMSIEQDRVQIDAGVRYGQTTGAPIALTIANRDAANWGTTLAVDEPGPGAGSEPVTLPRPGHADLMGALVYERQDLRDVIERSSARETAARVAVGSVAKTLLAQVGCVLASHVVRIGDVAATGGLDPADVARVEEDDVRCADPLAAARMREAIDAAAAAGDTLGGVVEVVAFGYPPGVGSYVQGDRRLQAGLAAAVLSVPAMKGVEFGLGFAGAALSGRQVHDPITWDAQSGYGRQGSRGGGLEGGISTGEPIVLRAAMKPISTLRSPLPSVDMATHERRESRYERSDTCAVPAAGIVLEAVVALTLADRLLDAFGGATVRDLLAAVDAFRRRLLER
jgi:chorismate synthase